MRGGRRSKDSKPIGVTKSLLAARNELQNYGVKDKTGTLFGSDFKNRRFQDQ
jgi:hypothetical protein